MSKPASVFLAAALVLSAFLAAPAPSPADDSPKAPPKFEDVDQNGDQHISKDEFWATFLDPSHSVAVFQKWDQDNNENLDREEYNAFLKQKKESGQ